MLSQAGAPLSWTSERADTLFVCERERKAVAHKRQPQRAERAIKHSAANARRVEVLDRNLLLITDPQADQAAEMAHEPLALMLRVGMGDRLSEHPIEVGR